jgi:uncharacterized membrane protein
MENFTNPQQANGDNGRTVAVLSYFTFVGWIIGLILHTSNKTSLGAFHQRQMLGLMLLVVIIYILGYPLIHIAYGSLLISILNLGLLVFWLMGVVSAINGKEKALPIVGDYFQKWFSGFGL